MAETKTYPMTVRTGAVKVASQTHLGVEYDVTLPTCSCPNFTLSRRGKADHDKHILAALTKYLAERGYDVVPSAR